MHLSMLPHQEGAGMGGGGGGLGGRITPRNYTILKHWALISYPCDTIFVSKIPWACLQNKTKFLRDFLAETFKVTCYHVPKSSVKFLEGSDCSGSLIPRVSPPPTSRGK